VVAVLEPVDVSRMVEPNRLPLSVAVVRCNGERRKQPGVRCGAKVADYPRIEEGELKRLSLRFECPACGKVSTLLGFLS
jgi:hypothetical protein